MFEASAVKLVLMVLAGIVALWVGFQKRKDKLREEKEKRIKEAQAEYDKALDENDGPGQVIALNKLNRLLND